MASTLENQVGYEDAMISGLLSTLNEEAQEDVLSEELRDSSENISFNVSMENLHKSYDTLSPTPSQLVRNNSHRYCSSSMFTKKIGVVYSGRKPNVR